MHTRITVKQQSGFAPLLGLVILLVIAIAAASTIYYFAQNENVNNNNNSIIGVNNSNNANINRNTNSNVNPDNEYAAVGCQRGERSVPNGKPIDLSAGLSAVMQLGCK